MALRALGYALCLLGVVDATQVMRRPDDYKTLLKPHVHPSYLNTSIIPTERALFGSSVEKRAGGKVSIGYFTNWSVVSSASFPFTI